MKTVNLIGVQHTNEEETVFIKTVISQVQPDVIFLELGEYRYKLIKEGVNLSTFMDMTKSRILGLNLRGRLVNNTLITVQAIQSLRSGTLFKSVDMKPAFMMGQELEIDVIPIDMEQHQIMNNLGTSTLNINNMQEFRQRFQKIRTEGTHDLRPTSKSEITDIDNLESLREMANRKKQVVPTYYKVLIEDRNEFMAENIIETMRNYDDGVAIIGALHVPGMITELQARGFDTSVYL